MTSLCDRRRHGYRGLAGFLELFSSLRSSRGHKALSVHQLYSHLRSREALCDWTEPKRLDSSVDILEVVHETGLQRLNKIDCCTTVIYCFTEPNEDTFGVSVDVFHLLHLTILLGDTALIDTYCINPESCVLDV